MNNKALVLLSGGQDSSTALFWALRRFEAVCAVGFDYNQRHRSELEAAKKIATIARIDYTILKIDTLSEISKNALTNSSIEIDYQTVEGRPPNTLVEGRNLLFLTYATIYAKQIEIDNLVIGVGQTDYSGYPDCRNEFIISANTTINLALDHVFVFHTPLMWMTKAQIWTLADELEVLEMIRTKTITCYHGIPGDGCGNCPSCILRRKGYDEFLLNKDSIQK